MGFEENGFRGLAGGPNAERTAAFYKEIELRRQEDQERERRALANAIADQKAVWALADSLLPADVREYADRHKMSETLPEMWRSAFVAGWRAYDQAQRVVNTTSGFGHAIPASLAPGESLAQPDRQ